MTGTHPNFSWSPGFSRSGPGRVRFLGPAKAGTPTNTHRSFVAAPASAGPAFSLSRRPARMNSPKTQSFLAQLRGKARLLGKLRPARRLAIHVIVDLMRNPQSGD